jgi:hypothetical protein
MQQPPHFVDKRYPTRVLLSFNSLNNLINSIDNLPSFILSFPPYSSYLSHLPSLSCDSSLDTTFCYEPSLQPCERGRYTLVTVQTRTVPYRDNALPRPRNRNHAIAIAVAITQSTLRHSRGDYPCCDCAFVNCSIASS